jgi:putative acetyltransferase
MARVSVRIDRVGLDATVAAELIAATNAELSQRYPEAGACHFRLDPDEVGDGRGAFFVAYLDSVHVGCGAVRRLDDATAELKRMYVRPTHRGRGVGGAILDALEAEARKLGVRRVVLETGVRQHEALAMYGRAGYARCEPYADEYFDSPLSVCMEKRL